MKKLELINLAVGLIVLVLLAIAGGYLQKLIMPAKDTAVSHRVEVDCDLTQRECTTVLDNKKLNLRFSKPVKYLEKINIELELTGFAEETPKKVLVDFTMQGMQMGLSRFELRKAPENNVWRGFAILPICVSGRKDWQVQLYMQTPKANYLVKFKVLIQA